jgi:hypothetical protein
MYPDDEQYDVDVRDRVYGNATQSREGRRSVVVVLLAVSVFLLVFSVSCQQVTAQGSARNIIEAGLISLTDLDQFLADEGPAIRQAALESKQSTIPLTGYPLDIVLTRDEVLKSSDAQLRNIILERSSALLYAEGVDAFDRTGNSSVRTFSLQGVMEFAVGQVSEANHSRATVFALIGIAGCAIFGAIAAATGQGWGRMRSVGFATAAGALPVVLLFALARVAVGAVGGGDPFEQHLRDISTSALTVPIRNGSIVFVAGVAMVVAAVVLSRVDRAVSGGAVDAAADEW